MSEAKDVIYYMNDRGRFIEGCEVVGATKLGKRRERFVSLYSICSDADIGISTFRGYAKESDRKSSVCEWRRRSGGKGVPLRYCYSVKAIKAIIAHLDDAGDFERGSRLTNLVERVKGAISRPIIGVKRLHHDYPTSDPWPSWLNLQCYEFEGCRYYSLVEIREQFGIAANTLLDAVNLSGCHFNVGQTIKVGRMTCLRSDIVPSVLQTAKRYNAAEYWNEKINRLMRPKGSSASISEKVGVEEVGSKEEPVEKVSAQPVEEKPFSERIKKLEELAKATKTKRVINPKKLLNDVNALKSKVYDINQIFQDNVLAVHTALRKTLEKLERDLDEVSREVVEISRRISDVSDK